MSVILQFYSFDFWNKHISQNVKPFLHRLSFPFSRQLLFKKPRVIHDVFNNGISSLGHTVWFCKFIQSVGHHTACWHMAVFTNFHSWLVFRNTTAFGLIKLWHWFGSRLSSISQGQLRKSETEWERGIERVRDSIWRYIAAQHAKTNWQLTGWQCSERRGLKSTAK